MRAAAFTLVLLATFGGQPARADDPLDTINRVYQHYLVPGADGLLSKKEKPELLSKRLNALLAHDEAQSNADYVGQLDFDPYVAGQDFQLQDFAVASDAVVSDKATITVRFTNFGHPTELTYSLVREDGAWKIDDIESKEPGHAWILSKILEPE